MLTSNTLTMPCRTPCKSYGIRGWSRPAGLATRDDITRLLGLEHVYELEHTYGVAAGQSVMVRDTTSAVLSHYLNTAREEIEWGRCWGTRRSQRR